MKKRIFYEFTISASLALVLITLIVSSCNFKFGDPSLLTEPTVDYSDSILTISIPRQSRSTSQINIYRQDVTKYKAANYDKAEILPIGVIFPSNLSSGGSTYQFQDRMVCAKHLYRYSVRYTEKKGKYYSEWSNVVTIAADAIAYDSEADDDDLTYLSEDAYISYDSTDYTFELSGKITAPSLINDFSTMYEPALLVKNDSTSQVFQLPASVANKIKNGDDSTVKFSIRNILSEQFLGTDIEILGILGQYKQYKASEDDSTSKFAFRAGEDESTSTGSEGSTGSEDTASTDGSAGSEGTGDSESTTGTDTGSTGDSETSSDSENANNTAEEEEEKPIMRIMWTKPVQINILKYPDNIINIPEGAATDGFDYSRSVIY